MAWTMSGSCWPAARNSCRVEPVADSKVLPVLVGKKRASNLLKPRRDRPPLENPKERVSIRLDAYVVQASIAKGRGGRLG